MSRSQIMGAFVALALVAGLVIVWQVTGDGESGDSPIEILTDSVGRQTLRDELTLNGELRRDELSTINSPFDGRVSQVGIADGEEIAAGDVILSLDGRPAVAANGEFSFYRTLDVGSDGPDVLQLERILFGSVRTCRTPILLGSVLLRYQVAFQRCTCTMQMNSCIHPN